MPCDRMHQMGLAETDPAVEEERVERDRVIGSGAGLRDPAGGGVSQLVWLAGDEVFEGEARVERPRKMGPVLADFGPGRGVRAAGGQARRPRGRRWAGLAWLGGRSFPGFDDYRDPVPLWFLGPPQGEQAVGVM